MSFRKWLPSYGKRKRRVVVVDPFATQTAQAMATVLSDLGLIDSGQKIRIVRVYAGRHQRSAGAWSWYAEDQTGREICGSQFTAREIITAHKTPGKCVTTYSSVGTLSLYPESTKNTGPVHDMELY